jgi:hypothetical protein
MGTGVDPQVCDCDDHGLGSGGLVITKELIEKIERLRRWRPTLCRDCDDWVEAMIHLHDGRIEVAQDARALLDRDERVALRSHPGSGSSFAEVFMFQIDAASPRYGSVSVSVLGSRLTAESG